MKALPLGGSKAAAVLKLSPWSTPWEVWASLTGRAPESEPTPAQLLGTRLEAAVMAAHAARVGSPIRTDLADRHAPGLTLRTAEGHVWMDVHPDGIYEENCSIVVVDAKASGDEPWADLPEHYRVQGAVQAAVAARVIGRHVRAEIVAYFHRFGVDRVYPVAYTHDLGERLLAHLEAWWVKHILGDEEPEITVPPRLAVEAVHPPQPERAWLDATPELEALVQQLASARATARSATDTADLARARILQALQGAPGVAGLVEAKSNAKGAVTLKLL